MAAAYPKMQLRVPAVTRYNGLFFGREIRMGLEVVATGLMQELVGEDARMPFEDRGEGEPIPVVANRRLLELYNKVFAPQRNLPRLTESMLVGFQILVELGRSWVVSRSLPGSQETSMQVVGFSERATLAGVSMPLASIRRINRKYGADAETYSSVLVRAQSADDVGDVVSGAKKLGLEIDDTERRNAVQIGTAVEIVTLALSLLAALITGPARSASCGRSEPPAPTWRRWCWRKPRQPASPEAFSEWGSHALRRCCSTGSRAPAFRTPPSSLPPSSASRSRTCCSASAWPCSLPCSAPSCPRGRRPAWSRRRH